MIHQEMGIGVSLALTQTKQTRKFLTDLPPHIGEAISPEAIHASVMYPEELARAGLASHEQARLFEINSQINHELGNLSIIGKQLQVVANVLHPFKKFVGIELIDDEGVGNQVRRVASDIVFDELGIRLANWLPDGLHVSVARRQTGCRRPLSYYRHFPKEFEIAGLTTSVGSVSYTTEGQPQSYINSSGMTSIVRSFS